jgi:hypothetical protein
MSYGVRHYENGQAEGQRHTKKSDAKRVAQVATTREVRCEDGRAAASEDEYECAEKLGAEALGGRRGVLIHLDLASSVRTQPDDARVRLRIVTLPPHGTGTGDSGLRTGDQ